MPTIDASIGGSASNSYLTVAEADTYFNGHIDASAWEKSTQKEELLIHATRLLDFYMDWDGDRIANETVQALDWPRYNVIDIPDNIIPVRVKNAVCELASYIQTKGSSFNLADASKIKVGPITIDIDADNSGFLLPPQISRILSKLGSPSTLPKNGISTVALTR